MKNTETKTFDLLDPITHPIAYGAESNEDIEKAYLIHIEMHVGNDTRHIHKLIYADSYDDAVVILANERPDYRGNDDPSYELQIKSGPHKLTENLWMLTEY